MDTRFHCVYLLTSLDPRCEGDFYVGYTVNPLRRLRQHNGELVNGARRTRRRGRPWTLVCCVSGFPDDQAALKFEWCWQHPRESARLRETLPVLLCGLRKLPYAIGVLHLLLRARLFVRLELTLHVLEGRFFREAMAIARGGGSAGSNPGEAHTTLPPLTPHALLHIEEITPDEFQSKYLSHEPASDSFRSTTSPLSCPYDLSVLSQTVQEAWGLEEERSHGGGGGEGATTWNSPKDASFSSSSLHNDYDASRVKAGDNDADNSEDEEAGRDGFSSPPARSRRSSQAASASASPTPSSSTPPRLAGNPSRSRPGRGLSPPLSPLKKAREASPPPTRRPWVPLRFKYYAADDFAREYLAEAEFLRCGLLTCTFCALPLREPYLMRCPRAPLCGLAAHIICLAMWMQHPDCGPRGMETGAGKKGEGEAAKTASSSGFARGGGGRPTLVPTQPRPCALCGELLHWGSLIRHLKQRAVKESRLRSHYRRLAVERRLQTRLERAHLIARKRQRPAARTGGASARVQPSKGPRGEGGDLSMGEEDRTSRAKSVSPPAIIVQGNTRVRGCSPPPARSAFHASGEAQARHGIREESIDPVEEWITDDRTLRITDFDENEWLNY